MTTEPEKREYYKLIFPTSIKYGDTLRVMQWTGERFTPGKYYPAGWRPVWGHVVGIRTFGKAVIITYTYRAGMEGQRATRQTLYYPGQYACLLLASGHVQPH